MCNMYSDAHIVNTLHCVCEWQIYALNAEMCKLEEDNFKAMKDAKV